MRILITGGTGLLGGRLIPKLAGNDHQVFALTRSASSHAKLRALGASPVAGDLESAFATCHVDNVVEAVQCALERGEGGRAFFITDQERLTFREFVAALASVQGLSIEKLRSMPYWLAATLGRLMDAVWAVTRKEGDPPISRSMMRMIGREFSVNDAAARRELGYVGRTSRTDGLRGYGEVLPSTASAVRANR